MNKQYNLDKHSTAAAASLHADILTTFEMPYEIEMSNDPFDHRTHRIIDIKPTDKDPYLRMILKYCPERQLPQLKDCKKGSSAI